MPHFFDFDLIRQPEPLDIAEGQALAAELVVLFLEGEERKDFLLNILKAAGYTNPKEEVLFLPLSEGNAAFDLSTLLLRQSKKPRGVLIFGLKASALGLHFNLGNYIPVEVNGVVYLLADDLLQIKNEKAAGNAQKAGALWRAVKATFAKNT